MANVPAAVTASIINPSDITFLRGEDGKTHADFALVIFVFNAEGAVVNHLSKDLHIASTAEEIKRNIALVSNSIKR